MINLLEKLLNFDLEFVYQNNWDFTQYQDYEMFKDYYCLFKKFGTFDAVYFINCFAKNLTNITGKKWQIAFNSGNCKIKCEDGQTIPIHSKLDRLKTSIQDKRSANFYIRTSQYQNLIYSTYKQVFEQNLIENVDELYLCVKNLISKYKNKCKQIDNQIDLIKKDYDEKNSNKNRFMLEAFELAKCNSYSQISQNLKQIILKYEYGYLKDGFFGEYNPASSIKDCYKMMTKLRHSHYFVGLHDTCKKVIITGNNLQIFGFKIDKSGRAIVSGSQQLFNKANKIVEHLSSLLKSDNFKRENLINADYTLTMDSAKFEREVSKIKSMINDFGKLILDCKADKVDEILNNIKENNPKVVLTQKYLKSHIFIEEIDKYASTLKNFCLKILTMLKELIEAKHFMRKQSSKDLLKSIIFLKQQESITDELTYKGSMYAKKINDLNYEKESIQQLNKELEEFASALNGFYCCEKEWN